MTAAHARVVSAIGPSRLAAAAQCIGAPATVYAEYIREVAFELGQQRITLAVNGDSETTELLARTFLDRGGLTVECYVSDPPRRHRTWPRGTEIVRLPPELIPLALVQTADVVLCVGFGIGTVLEICLAKLHSRAHVLICRHLVSRPLPAECAFDRLSYIDSATQLAAALESPWQSANASR